MDGLCTSLVRCLQDGGYIQVAFGCGSGADAHRLIGFQHVAGTGIGFGVDGHRAYAELLECADDAASDLAAVRNKHFMKHD